MHGYIVRNIESEIQSSLNHFPVVAVLGPRQCGKSTTAKTIAGNFQKFSYIDFERPRDLRKIDDLEIFFSLNRDGVICFDEIQRKAEIFPHLRSLIDDDRENTNLILLGSASPDLLKQSSETLAGRIHYIEQTPFLADELETGCSQMLFQYWNRGGFPQSFLSDSDETSLLWRESFLSTFLERDFPNLGINVPPPILRRLLTMIAHSQGQVINYSKIAASLHISSLTVKKYVELFEKMFLVRTLPPMEANIKKRLVKSPKVYIRDTGLLHALLEIDSFDQLLSNPVYGASWETLAIENILSSLKRFRSGFYRTSNGNEIDLVLTRGTHRIGVEFKAGTAPGPGRGLWLGKEDLNLDEIYLVAPIHEIYPLKKSLFVSGINEFINKMKENDDSG